MFNVLTAVRRNMVNLSKSRLIMMGAILIVSILLLGGLYWIVEDYGNKGLTYVDSLKAIGIFTISGFDTDPPDTFLGWVAAVFSLMFGIVLVGAFTAEIAAIFVESRLKAHSAVKYVNFSKHIIVCGHLSDPEHFADQFFHPDREDVNTKLVFLFSEEPSVQMEVLLNRRKYKKQIKYVIGSPLITEDLEKVNAHLAKGAFIFTNRFVKNYDKQDAKTILTALSIEAYNEDIDTYVQLLKTKNLDSLLATGTDNYIVLDSLSSNLFAYSCLNPGLSELICNLLIASEDDNESRDASQEVKEYEYGAGQEIYKI